MREKKPALQGKREKARALSIEIDALLARQNELMEQAACAADSVARMNVFARYRHRKSVHTKRMHRAALGLFMAYLKEAGVELTFHLADEPRLWTHISFGLVEGFMLWMEDKGYKIKTMNDYLSIVQLYAGLAYKADIMNVDTLLKIKGILSIRGSDAFHIEEDRKRRKVAPVGKKKAAATTLTPEQFRTLLNLPNTPQGKRDRVVILLLYAMGMRPGEVVALKLSDLHLDEGYYRLTRLKTYQEQELEFQPDLAVALQEYLLERRDWTTYCAEPSKENDAPLLVQSLKTTALVEQCDMQQRIQDGSYRNSVLETRKGHKEPSADWSTPGMYKYIRRLSTKLGLPPLSPYDGRHQWAKDAADSGTNYIHLLKAGGWSAGSRMPDRYYGDHRVLHTQVKLTVRENTKSGSAEPEE